MAAKKKKAARKSARKSAKKSATRKRATKRAAKKTTKKAAKKKKTARKPNAAFMRPVQPDTALSAVVGSNPLPRTELTKKLWSYIKRKGLQDKVNKRMINADENLKRVFGGRNKVTMFEMTSLVNKHVR